MAKVAKKVIRPAKNIDMPLRNAALRNSSASGPMCWSAYFTASSNMTKYAAVPATRRSIARISFHGCFFILRMTCQKRIWKLNASMR